MKRTLQQLSALSNSERRALGRDQNDLTCYLVQVAITITSALVSVEARLEALEHRHRLAAEIIKALAPWTGLILALALWATGNATLNEVKQSAGLTGR